MTGEGAWGRARWVIAPHKRGAMAPRFRGQARSARPRSPLLGAIFPCQPTAFSSSVRSLSKGMAEDAHVSANVDALTALAVKGRRAECGH